MNETANRQGILLIGIDCATEDAKIGLAAARYAHGRAVVVGAECGHHRGSAAAFVSGWVLSLGLPTILALDAPLGWPVLMGELLPEHEAGLVVSVEPDQFFRRETDRFVQRRLGKRDLDVGADRIARTAHAALRLLEEVRQATKESIPLAWDREFPGVAAIEVYPAATLTARGLPATAYKKPEQKAERSKLLRALRNELDLEAGAQAAEANADILDAIVCVLAAQDFIQGRALPPEDRRLATKEGWIWTAPASDR